MFLYYLRNILTKMGPKRLQKVPQQRDASRETFLAHEYYKKEDFEIISNPLIKFI